MSKFDLPMKMTDFFIVMYASPTPIILSANPALQQSTAIVYSFFSAMATSQNPINNRQIEPTPHPTFVLFDNLLHLD